MNHLKIITLCLLAVIITLLSTGSVVSQQQRKLNTVKVLTYNIYGGRNTDQARDLDRIATVIKTLDPDIVALQEVDRHTGRLNGVDLAKELGRLTGMQHVFGRAMKYDGGEYGEAILSKFPMTSVINHALPTVPLRSEDDDRQEVEPRAALAVKLKFPDTDQEFIFIGTHLDHLRDPSNRNIQAEALVGIIDQYKNTPLILAGDLNAVPDSDAISTIRTQWTDTWPAKRISGTNRSRTRRIDYVFYTPSSRWNVIRTYPGTDIKADDETWQNLLTLASDHLPVIAELELIR